MTQNEKTLGLHGEVNMESRTVFSSTALGLTKATKKKEEGPDPEANSVVQLTPGAYGRRMVGKGKVKDDSDIFSTVFLE